MGLKNRRLCPRGFFVLLNPMNMLESRFGLHDGHLVH